MTKNGVIRIGIIIRIRPRIMAGFMVWICAGFGRIFRFGICIGFVIIVVIRV